ncbi:MAG: hypothetical protein ABSG71_05900 [Thermodesulfobacteriota bacterium]
MTRSAVQVPPFRAVCKAPLRAIPEPSVWARAEGKPQLLGRGVEECRRIDILVGID